MPGHCTPLTLQFPHPQALCNMGIHRRPLWPLLLFVAALMLLVAAPRAWAATGTDAAASETAAKPATNKAKPSPARTLVVVQVNMSEPVGHVADFLACTFQARRPTVTDIPFDVLVVLAGRQSAEYGQRERAVMAMVEQAVAESGAGPGRNAVAVRAARAPPAGMNDNGAPRTLPPPPGGTVVGMAITQIVPGLEASSNDVLFRLLLGMDDDDSAGGGDRFEGFKPSPDESSPPPTRQLYAYAVILDTHVCALRVGWLDTALAPLLRHQHVLVSGAPVGITTTINDGDGNDGAGGLALSPRPLAGKPLIVRLSPEGLALLGRARVSYGARLPCEQAIYAAARAADDAHPDGPSLFIYSRLLAVESPVDAQWFTDAAYYGFERRAVLVHAPRHLRVAGLLSVAAHLKENQPAVIIVLPPAATPGLRSMIASVAAPFLDDGMSLNRLAFIACSRAALEVASSVVPQRVLMTAAPAAAESVTGHTAEDLVACSGSASLEAAASLAFAGVNSIFITGLDSAFMPDTMMALLMLDRAGSARAAAGDASAQPTIFVQPGDLPPMHKVAPSSALINVGATYVSAPPGTAVQAGEALLAWAAALHQDAHLTRDALAGVLSPRVRVATLPATNFSWGGDVHANAVFQAHNKDKNKRRTREPAIMYSVGFTPSSVPLTLARWADATTFRLRQAGLWSSGTGAICSTFSMVSHTPTVLDSPSAVGQALRRVTAFMAFAKHHRLDCAVMPRFVLGGAGGPIVPFDAVLDGEALRDAAGPDLVLFPRLAHMDATIDGFIQFRPGSGRARAVNGLNDTTLPSPPHTALRHMRMAGAGRSSHGGRAVTASPSNPVRSSPHFKQFRRGVLPGLPRESLRLDVSDGVPITGAATAASGNTHRLNRAVPPFAATLFPTLTRRASDAVRSTSGSDPPSSLPVCLHDSRRRTASEAAVLAVEGGMAALATLLPRMTNGRPVLVTGPAWRRVAGLLRAVAVAAGVHDWTPTFDVLTSVDILQQSAASSTAWAPIMDFAICSALHGTTGQPPINVRALLPRPMPSAALLPRLAAHMWPDILADDLEAFASWLRLRERPRLHAGGAWVRLPARAHRGDSNHVASVLRDARHAIDALMATGATDLAFILIPPIASASGHPQPWSTAVGADIATSFYRAFPQALPSTIGFLLNPATLLEFADCFVEGLSEADLRFGTGRASHCASLPISRETHPDSKRLLLDVRHSRALAVLRRRCGRMVL